MQPILALDFLEQYGAPVKFSIDSALFKLTQERDIFTFHDDGRIIIDHSIIENFHYPNQIAREVIIGGMKQDYAFQQSSMVMYKFHEHKPKKYVFSRPLVKALSRCNTDLECSLFDISPRSIYIELPGLKDDCDDSEILGVILTIEHYDNATWISYLCITLGGSSSLGLGKAFTNRRFMKLKMCPDMTIEQIRRYALDKNMEKNVKHMNIPQDNIERLHQDYKDGVTDRCVFNALAYILSNDENLKAEVNQFATKKSKREGQLKVYTTSEFYPVGKDFQFVKLMTTENTWVDPFYRWQRCGPGWSKVKFILVKGHERTYQKGINNDGTNSN